MIAQTPWLERDFAFGQPIGVFHPLLERLRGTPARARELVAGLSEDLLAARVNEKWSAKEHLGHLSDLQQLDDLRLTEFLSHARVLSAADIENRATESANHRRIPVEDLIRRLAAGREELVGRLDALTQEEVAFTAVHPRLKQSMRILDWIYFLAEHDDHHLSLARGVISVLRKKRNL